VSDATAVVVGAVLCGGRSTRMGRDKATLDVDGVPMAGRVAAALRAAGCAAVVAIGGDPLALAPVGLDVVGDDHPGEGPLGGILTALRWFGSRAEAKARVVVVSCDVPWIAADDVRRMIDAPAPAGAVVVAHSTRREPLCAVWPLPPPPSVVAAFAAGERAVHRALATLEVVEIGVDPAALRNVNTPTDVPRRAEGR
jgi:molybdopterin-guanine dinucleotide biosynthesis protein A